MLMVRDQLRDTTPADQLWHETAELNDGLGRATREGTSQEDEYQTSCRCLKIY
jgi:hypothetical protein